MVGEASFGCLHSTGSFMSFFPFVIVSVFGEKHRLRKRRRICGSQFRSNRLMFGLRKSFLSGDKYCIIIFSFFLASSCHSNSVTKPTKKSCYQSPRGRIFLSCYGHKLISDSNLILTYIRMLELPTDSRFTFELLEIWGSLMWHKFGKQKSLGTTHL